MRVVDQEDERVSSSYAPLLLEGDAFAAALLGVAQDAAADIAGVDAAGAVVHRGGSVDRACSGPLASIIDTAQYELDQGPCLHAFHTSTVVLLDLGVDDGRWPDFQAAAVTAGARSTLSIPLLLADRTIGSLNLYGLAHQAFSRSTVRQAELFARPAALRLSHIGVAVHAVDAAEVVGLELQDRATVDRAIGVLMELHLDGSVERGRRRLEQIAGSLGVGVPQAAVRIVSAPPRPGGEE